MSRTTPRPPRERSPGPATGDSPREPAPEHLDVVVMGAGLAGIGVASRLRRALPDLGCAVLEARGTSGGTWDLFRYPGVRSDSDMYTLGYPFRPWSGVSSMADGSAILDYLRRTAAEEGIEERIRYHHRVVAADWSGTTARWTLTVERGEQGEPASQGGDAPAPETVTMTCDFLVSCCGYYRYDRGHAPELPGAERFTGLVVHPQHWPEGLDHAGRRVVVIGSGATAVTLAPALAGAAASVTILQRSPSYVVSRSRRDRLAEATDRVLPGVLAHALTRARYITLSVAFYELCRRRPRIAAALIRRALLPQLPAGFDVGTHFAPRYQPWDQRVCLVPDGDLFRALREGRVDLVTDEVASFTPTGLLLGSGRVVEADIVVTATGLALQAFGGARLSVNGRELDLSATLAYKGAMLGGVPNFAFVLGYVNASWTLKVDLVARFVVRVLQRMRSTGQGVCVARPPADMPTAPLLDLSSGYVRRSLHRFPRQGTRAPWRLRMNYFHDVWALRLSSVSDGVLAFSPKAAGREDEPARTTGTAAASQVLPDAHSSRPSSEPGSGGAQAVGGTASRSAWATSSANR